MSQRRRQARLLSLRFTGPPPPPPRLCGPRPARVPAAGAPPRAPLGPPRLGARWGRPHGPQRRPERSRGSSAARGQRGGVLLVGGPPRAGPAPLRLRLPQGPPAGSARLRAEPGGWNLSPGVAPAPAPASTCATRAAPREAARALGSRRRADGARPGPGLRPAPPLRARSRRPTRRSTPPPRRPTTRSFRARAERVLRAPRASPPPAAAESWVTRAFDPRSPEWGWKFPGMSPCSSFRGAPSISSPSHGRIPRAPAAPPPLNPAGNDVPPLCVLSSSSGSRLLTRSPRQVGPRRHRPGPLLLPRCLASGGTRGRRGEERMQLVRGPGPGLCLGVCVCVCF